MKINKTSLTCIELQAYFILLIFDWKNLYKIAKIEFKGGAG